MWIVALSLKPGIACWDFWVIIKRIHQSSTVRFGLMIGVKLIRWGGALGRYRNCIERLVASLGPQDCWHLQILRFLLLVKIKLWWQEKVGVAMANLPARVARVVPGRRKGGMGRVARVAWGAFGKRVAGQMSDPGLSIYHWEVKQWSSQWQKTWKIWTEAAHWDGGQGLKSSRVKFSKNKENFLNTFSSHLLLKWILLN